MLHVLNKTNTTIHDIFLYFKIYYVKKKPDLYLRKIQINFLFYFIYIIIIIIIIIIKKKKKTRFASKEDVDPFLF